MNSIISSDVAGMVCLWRFDLIEKLKQSATVNMVTQMHGEKLPQQELRKMVAVQTQSTASHGRFEKQMRNQLKDKRPKKKRKVDRTLSLHGGPDHDVCVTSSPRTRKR